MCDYDRIREILDKSSYTVALCGTGMMKESGMVSVRAPERAYDIEIKYGYSPEEIFTSVFYTNRPEMFFKYYREEMLKPKLEPSEGFAALAELERRGKLQCCITNNVYDLPKRAGCEKVLNLHGTIFENSCPHCGRKYPMEYIRDMNRVPLCEDCQLPIRPGVLLFGEQVDNQVMTKAVEEVQKAEVLLVLGSQLNSGLCEGYLRYFQGHTLVLIHTHSHYLDTQAEVSVTESVKDALPKIVWPEGKPA